MLHQILRSPQVKLWVIITYEHGIYELISRVKTEDLRKLGNIRKLSKLHIMIA